MWRVDKLVAVNGSNSITIDNRKITLAVEINGIKIRRQLDCTVTPPCLSVAVIDLINELSEVPHDD